MMCKVYTDVFGIKRSYSGCHHVSEIIHSQKHLIIPTYRQKTNGINPFHLFERRQKGVKINIVWENDTLSQLNTENVNFDGAWNKKFKKCVSFQFIPTLQKVLNIYDSCVMFFPIFYYKVSNHARFLSKCRGCGFVIYFGPKLSKIPFSLSLNKVEILL